MGRASFTQRFAIGLGAVVAASLLLGSTQLAFNPVASAGAVLASIIGAALLCASWSPGVAAFGSLAALALFGPLRTEPLLAAPLFLMLLHAPRALRARHRVGVGVGLGLALFSGLAIAVMFDLRPTALHSHAAMLFVALALCAAPLIVAVDDRITATLMRAASDTRGKRRFGLLRAVAIRRAAQPAGTKSIQSTLRRGWRELAEMARDEKYDDASRHAHALGRAYRAARALQRARQDLDQRDTIHEAEERLAAELAALQEVQAV